jgi:hypothetical protein
VPTLRVAGVFFVIARNCPAAGEKRTLLSPPLLIVRFEGKHWVSDGWVNSAENEEGLSNVPSPPLMFVARTIILYDLPQKKALFVIDTVLED